MITTSIIHLYFAFTIYIVTIYVWWKQLLRADMWGGGPRGSGFLVGVVVSVSVFSGDPFGVGVLTSVLDACMCVYA